jgi:hypothetical protein
MNHRAITSLTVLALAISATAAFSGRWIPLASSGSSVRTVGLSSTGSDAIVLDITLPGLDVSEAKTKDGDYVLLSIPDHGYTTEPGHPKLPVVSEWVEIPQGAKVEAFLEVIAWESFNLKDKGFDKKIMPVQLPVPKVPGAEEKVPFSIDQTIYSSNEFYGKAKVALSEPVQMRGHRAVLVSIWPVSYNPVSGDVKAITSAKINIRLSGGDPAKTSQIIQKYRSAVYDRPVSSALINYDQFDVSAKAAPALPINQLIITGDQYYDVLAPLIEWDTRKGYRVFVTRTSEVPGGADTASIRQYIKDQYDGENPPDFVLLVGDVEVIPAYIASSANNPATDLYYSTMAGTDYLPDLYVSRISVADTIQLKNYIAKYMGYQQGQWSSDQGWMRKAYFMASNDYSYHGLAEATNNYCLTRVRAHGMAGDSLYAYGSYGGTPVADALNQGRTVATYTGHGAVTYWDGPSFNQAGVNALTNADKYPLVTSFACLTGQFTYSECFGETWIRAADKGAMAFWGSSVTSYWDEDDILQRRLYDAFLDSGYAWIGGMTTKAKLDYFRTWGNIPMTKRYFEMYNIMGNGAIDLYTQQPLTLTVTHPAKVSLGATTVAVNVAAGDPVAGALVGLVLKSTGKVLAAGYTDSLGRAALNIETTGTGDSIRLTVTAHNCRPYSGGMGIAVSGPFVMYIGHSLNDAAGNGDGSANPGEAIALPLWVKNCGSTISIGTVKGALGTTSPLIAITDSLHNFGIIYPGDSALYSAGYRFSVSPACTNGAIIPFTLRCRDTEDGWTSIFAIRVQAPKLRFNSYSVADPAPANNNGFAEPGETDSIAVSLKNYGAQTADDVKAVLSSSDPYVTVISDSAGFGDIADQQTRWSDIPYLVSFGSPPQTPYYAWMKLQMRTLGGAITQTDSFAIAIASPGFLDDVEDSSVTSQYQAEDLWHITEYTYHSPSKSWRCGVGDGENYLNGMNASLTTPEFVLGAANTVSFWHKYAMENNYDFGLVEYSADGGLNWSQLASFTGTASDWSQASYDIVDVPQGAKGRLRFRFTSDYSVTALGWHLDDIQITPWTKSASEGGDDRLPPQGIVRLNQNYPNPMRFNTVISYQVPQKTLVSLSVYNILGQNIRTLDSGEKPPGAYRVNWDGRDNTGGNMASGIYFYRLTAGAAALTQKLILIR